jgi:hypothetical protein
MIRAFLYFSGICIFFVVLSCKDNQPADFTTNTKQITDIKLFGNPDAMLPDFSQSSENYISQWPVFDDLITEVLAINQSSLKTIQQRSNILVSRMDSLTKNIPDTLNTQPIYASSQQK